MGTSESAESARPSRQKRVGDALRQDTRYRLCRPLRKNSQFTAARGRPSPALPPQPGSPSRRCTWPGAASGPCCAATWRTHFPGAQAPRRTPTICGFASPRAACRASGPGHRDRRTRRNRMGLYRDASAVDPEIAADWNEPQLLHHRLFTRILDGVPDSALAEGHTTKTAADTAWTIASPESCDLLVRRLGYQLGEFHDWMRQNLITAILARLVVPGGEPGADHGSGQGAGNPGGSRTREFPQGFCSRPERRLSYRQIAR